MARQARVAPGGMVYHVLNRSAGRFKMFRKDADFQAFERVITETHKHCPLRILSYCVLPTHWQFVVWPRHDGELSEFFRRLANTHAVRWRVAHNTVGWGHLYQGRFRSFFVQPEEPLLTVCRFVERRALTEGLVKTAESWQWGSLALRKNGSEEQQAILAEWPVVRRADWVDWVNAPISAEDVQRLDASVARGRPFGSADWVSRMVKRYHLESTLSPLGRPRRAGKPPSVKAAPRQGE